MFTRAYNNLAGLMHDRRLITKIQTARNRQLSMFLDLEWDSVSNHVLAAFAGLSAAEVTGALGKLLSHLVSARTVQQLERRPQEVVDFLLHPTKHVRRACAVTLTNIQREGTKVATLTTMFRLLKGQRDSQGCSALDLHVQDPVTKPLLPPHMIQQGHLFSRPSRGFAAVLLGKPEIWFKQVAASGEDVWRLVQEEINELRADPELQESAGQALRELYEHGFTAFSRGLLRSFISDRLFELDIEGRPEPPPVVEGFVRSHAKRGPLGDPDKNETVFVQGAGTRPCNGLYVRAFHRRAGRPVFQHATHQLSIEWEDQEMSWVLRENTGPAVRGCEMC